MAAALVPGPAAEKPIREQVWVQTPVDSDADGRPDRVAVRIIRPGSGPRVPAILEASPYFAGIHQAVNHTDLDRSARIPSSGLLDDYFVPRGYAVLSADSLGTGGSDGCPTSGGRNETLGIKAVVDWLNGRAPAFDESGAAVTAAWTTGRTGMIGTSYNGTLPNAVATTGVPGLETIVPIAAISSWYDYYRANGGVVAPGGYPGEDADVLARAVLTRKNPKACAAVMTRLEREQDRQTGDYNRFWAERDYLRDVDRVRASVFVVHGLHDENVRTQQFGQWWDALAARGVPRKIWLHQGGHADPAEVRREVWLATLDRWFGRWLKRLDTGIMREPMADVEVAPGRWETARNWPVPGSRPVPVRFDHPGTIRQTFVDNPARTAESLVAAGPNRSAYRTAKLTRDTRWSGRAEVTVRADLTGPSPYLTALLVDHGAASPTIVSRGWLDVRNRISRDRTTPVVAGRTYQFRWKLQPGDHVFAAGHRIGLVLISTERDHTLRYPAGTVIGVRPGSLQLILDLAPGTESR
ncbi:MAG: Xaa-Pro dipeptidyl-peptidase [Actinoplanes sp.]